MTRTKNKCHDCGASIGEIHHFHCDMEQCPFCRGQVISCDCWSRSRHRPGEFPHPPLKWKKELEKKGRIPWGSEEGFKKLLTCEKCGADAACYFSTRNMISKYIDTYILRCPACGHEQSEEIERSGKWSTWVSICPFCHLLGEEHKEDGGPNFGF